MSEDAPRDNGFKSRKLWFSVFAVATIFGGATLGAHWTSFAPLYDTLVGGIVAVAGLFLTGQVATKWVNTKMGSKSKPPQMSRSALETRLPPDQE